MNHARVQKSLSLIAKIYRDILEEDSAATVFPRAIERVKTTKEAYDKARRNKAPWGYKIDHDEPLRFKKSEIRDLDLRVDVYCDIQWEEDDIPVKQDIKVRIWCEHSETIYRSEFDSQNIEEKLCDPDRKYSGRVVSRYHFDKAAQGQERNFAPRTISEFFPEYHLQVGGIPQEYELCWHPKKVNIPRLIYHPMELFLTCQMIAASFFPQQYLDIQREGDWQGELRWYQEKLLKGYYEKCLDAINNNESLLDALKL